MIKGAIFDQDGLLFDTESVYAKAWIEVSDRHGYGMTDAMTRTISGYGRAEIGSQIARYLPTIDVEAYIDETMIRARELLLSGVPVLKPGVRETLEACRARGIRTAVASSAPRDCVTWNLTSSGLRSLFDAVITGEDVQNGKPAPDIFLKAAAAIQVPPEACVVFEDAFAGIRAAVAAGCSAVLVPDRRSADDEMRRLALVANRLSPTLLDKVGQNMI